jgi:CheY-like chemotaxis protein
MAANATGSTRGAGETLLVVEDDDSLRRLITRILTRNGYEVLDTASSKEALTICDEHAGSIDLLLTDVNMPEMQGNELARRIAETHPGMRTLFMSGGADDSITRHGFLEPGEGFVQKPFSVEELLQKIGHALLY